MQEICYGRKGEFPSTSRELKGFATHLITPNNQLLPQGLITSF